MKNIKILNEKILENIEELLTFFKLDYKIEKNKISMACPIHDGDKDSAVTIYTDSGKWYCWTQGCHEKHQSNLFAFFRVLLNKSVNETVLWFEKYFGEKLPEEIIDKKLTKFDNIFLSQVEQNGVPRYKVLESLKIPSEYFQKRGFSKEILLKYDVGECFNHTKQMYKRAVVPVYDLFYKFMTGCVGRRIVDNSKYPKWINSEDFKRTDNLYNIWFAKEHIDKTNTVIIVEGQGDVWRLEEAGIHNSIGIFGSTITENQLLILEKLPIFNMILLTDNDSAGIEARNKIKQKCSRLYNIIDVSINTKDVGEMSVSDIKNIIVPQLEKI